MAVRTGSFLYCDYGVSASTISTSVGKVTGGTWALNNNPQHREGIGTTDTMVPGTQSFNGSINFDVQEKTLIQKAIRTNFTSPTMTALTFAGGIIGDAMQFKSCLIDTLTLSQEVNGCIKAALGFKGLECVTYTAAAMAAQTALTREWYKTTATINSTGYTMQSWTLDIRNNLQEYWSLDAAGTTNQTRWPDGIAIGRQEVSFRCSILTRPTTNMIADILNDAPATDNEVSIAVATDDTITIALAGLMATEISPPFDVGNNIIRYDLAFEAPYNLSTAVSIT